MEHQIIFEQSKDALNIYEPIEISINLDKRSVSKGDPISPGIKTVFITPDGRTVSVPAFLYQDYERSLKDGKEVLTKKGELSWKVRFTPLEEGIYDYKLIIDNKEAGKGSFEVRPSNFDGFVRVKEEYFVLDSGKRFFPVGLNVAWAGSKGTYEYEYYFKKISENQGDYSRVIMAPWDTAIEWNSIGKYDLGRAWKIDKILETAAAENIRIVLTFDTYGELKRESDDPREMLWNENPYYPKGSLKNPEEFFTNNKANEEYKKRLEYIVARWGYSPNIMAWEFWNEVDLTDGYDEQTTCTWHNEMASYLKSIDHNSHLITTSCASSKNCDCMFSLPEVSYTQAHKYDLIDEKIIKMISEEMITYKKPWLLSEFGLGRDSEQLNKDTNGEYLNSTMWSAALVSAGSAMPWWWDEYVDAKDLYHLFKPLSTVF